MKKILVLDGNSILNRAFYGIHALSNHAGVPTNGVFGFLQILKKHLDALSPDGLACAFDVREKTFRHKAYEAYKGTRKGMPEELAVQLPYAKEAVRSLGFTILESPGYEADDILGTVSAMAEAADGYHCYLLTGDRDSLQLVSDKTTVLLMKNKEDILYTPTRFTEEYGITPMQFIDVKALMGDTSDNIPGVPGIGEKTALKLIQTAGNLDTLYNEEKYKEFSPSVQKKLIEGKESAMLSRMLATIRRDIPIDIAIDALAPKSDPAAFCALCRELDLTTMPKKFGMEAAVVARVVENLPTPTAISVEEAAAIDTPVLHLSGDTLWLWDGARILTTAPDALDALTKKPFVCHDVKSLIEKTGCMTDTCVFDTMLAGYLLDPGRSSYPVDRQAREQALPLADTLDDAQTVWAIGKLHAIFADELAETGMTRVFSEIELPLAPVLADMETVGFKIDPDGIIDYAKGLQSAENALATSIWMQAGHEFNIQSPKQLGEVLFEELSLPAGRKTKTGYSTDAETLERLLPYHEIVSDILSYRQIAKLRGTYGEPLARLADEHHRIHTKLNQTGTATGRLSSNDPNLQNIPIRMEMGRELRKYFIPENENYVLLDADYSQIELRLLAHLAGDDAMREAFIEKTDIHTKVASQVFGVPEDEVTPELRRRAKAVNFGIVYGIGDYSLSQDLHISRKKAAEYIESYLATYPGVDRYLKTTVEKAHADGYTTTMYGRRRYIPELSSKNRNLRAFGERVAMNSPIQGSAADIIKIAMIRVHRALAEAGIDARLIMQVHDELVVESAKSCADTAREILVREMESAADLTVPLVAEAGMGKNWYEVK